LVKRFAFISTVEAAGFGDGIHPRRESEDGVPVNQYGQSKKDAEKLVLQDRWNFETVVFRLPMLYGPGTFLIVPKLYGMVRKGVYPIIGSGNTLMEFCYVDNAISGIITALDSHCNCNREIYYLSDSRSYSILEVIRAIAKSLNKKVLFIKIPVFLAYCIGFLNELLAKIFPVPPFISSASKKPFFSRETVFWTTHNVNIVSTEKARKELNFRPYVTIEQGTQKTAQWLQKVLWKR
jgi:UDP-glucose 4-epimerase